MGPYENLVDPTKNIPVDQRELTGTDLLHSIDKGMQPGLGRILAGVATLGISEAIRAAREQKQFEQDLIDNAPNSVSHTRTLQVEGGDGQTIDVEVYRDFQRGKIDYHGELREYKVVGGNIEII